MIVTDFLSTYNIFTNNNHRINIIICKYIVSIYLQIIIITWNKYYYLQINKYIICE